MNDALMRLAVTLTIAAVVTACGTAPETTDQGPSPTPTIQTPDGTEDAADDATGDAAGSQLAAVALRFDRQPVPIANACSGADGAVLVTTEGEVTVTLVREDGVALRYSGEGMTAETADVTVEEVGESTIYRATLESDEVPAVDVSLELGDTSTLEDCRA